jgi:glycosyltransferase involved in cell wall biosynthesis
MKDDRRVQYFRQDENRGPTFNFDFVLKKATGKYFMWAADDDYFEDNDLISRLVSKAREGNYVLVFPNVNLIMPNQTIKGHMTKVFKDCRTDYEYLISWCGYGGGFPFYGFYNLELMSLSGLDFRLDEDLRYFNEGTFLHRVFLHGGARFVEDVSFNFTWASRLTPYIRLVDFLRYTRRVLLLYVSSKLSLAHKIRIITRILKNHMRYIRSVLLEMPVYYGHPAIDKAINTMGRIGERVRTVIKKVSGMPK